MGNPVGALRGSDSVEEALALISHELRAPLASMLGRSELLLDDVYGSLDAAQRGAVEGIARSGRYVLNLLDGLLTLIRCGAGEAPAGALIDIDLLCMDSLDITRSPAREKGVRLVANLAADLPTTCADATQIMQILVNLLTNAVRYTHAGGSVGLDSAYDPNCQMIMLTVWDTGIGIAPEDHERIFQPFLQLERRATSGLGIGLALVQRMVASHGGRVDVASNIGAGSRFTVHLPVRSPADFTTGANPFQPDE
jgi:signal transduction histidine kinase